MANFFTAPRSRPIIYTPEADLTRNVGKDAIKQSALKDTAKRILSDNIPILDFAASKDKKSTRFILPGVQRVSWAYLRDVTEQYGLQRYTLLPWYTKAVVLTVSGRYYMGAFTQDTIVSAASLLVNENKTLIAWIRKEMSDLDRRITNLGVIGKQYKTISDQKMLSSMDVGPRSDPDSMSLLGFIRRFKIDESVESPFIQSYDLEYIGIDRDWYLESASIHRVTLDGQIPR